MLVLKKNFDLVEIIKHLIIVEHQLNQGSFQFQFSSDFLPQLYSALEFIKRWADCKSKDELFLKGTYEYEYQKYVSSLAKIKDSISLNSSAAPVSQVFAIEPSVSPADTKGEVPVSQSQNRKGM